MGAAADRAVTRHGGGAAVHALLVRAALAQWLAACFRYPEAGSATRLRSALGRLVDSATPYPELATLVSRLAAALEAVNDDTLQLQYSRLFIGTGASPLHESAYGPRRLTTAAELADVRGFYRAFGFDLSETTPETADHVGAELEFHAALVVKLAWAYEQALGDPVEITSRAAASFLDAHLGRWIPALAHRLASCAADSFHARVAAEAERFVSAECRGFGVEPAAVSGEPAGKEPETFTCPHAASCG